MFQWTRCNYGILKGCENSMFGGQYIIICCVSLKHNNNVKKEIYKWTKLNQSYEENKQKCSVNFNIAPLYKFSIWEYSFFIYMRAICLPQI